MDKNILELTILDQRDNFDKKKDYLIRKVDDNLIETKKITVISGIRRCGKSTLLKQISQKYKNYFYLNFEDERLLDFTYNDFNNLHEIFLKLYGKQKVFFFDEIQNIFGWEKFVRRLFEDGYKIFVTGSNAKLLSSELATALTGRHLKIELYPFSFREYLNFHKFDIESFYTTKKKSQLMKYFESYLNLGGFPEVVVSQDAEELKQLYQDTIVKDLIIRFKIRDIKSFRELILFLMSNVTKKISFNNLKNILDFKSTTTVKNYIDFLEETYLMFSLYKFDYSIKKQIINDRKIYSIDTGLVNAVSFKFSKDIGRVLENIVFLEFKRKGKDIYYHGEDNKSECDFIVREGFYVIKCFQVTQGLQDLNTRGREIAGLIDAMRKYKLREGIILTQDEEDLIEDSGFKIIVKPVWKWLLED